MKLTEAQDNYLCVLHDRVKKNYDSNTGFYEIVERISGQRTITNLTKDQASKIIQAVKEELL